MTPYTPHCAGADLETGYGAALQQQLNFWRVCVVRAQRPCSSFFFPQKIRAGTLCVEPLSLGGFSLSIPAALMWRSSGSLDPKTGKGSLAARRLHVRQC